MTDTNQHSEHPLPTVAECDERLAEAQHVIDNRDDYDVSKGPEFIVELSGSWDLSVEDIWPDGDAPENPTAEMVAQRMRDYGSMMYTLREWCLEPQEVTVYGNHEIAEVWVV